MTFFILLHNHSYISWKPTVIMFCICSWGRFDLYTVRNGLWKLFEIQISVKDVITSALRWWARRVNSGQTKINKRKLILADSCTKIERYAGIGADSLVCQLATVSASTPFTLITRAFFSLTEQYTYRISPLALSRYVGIMHNRIHCFGFLLIL